MTLTPIGPSQFEQVAGWLAVPETSRWLDFGAGQESLSAPALAFMAGRSQHVLRLFGVDTSARPVGIVALSQVCPRFRTATLWYVLGDQRYRGQGYTSCAVSALLLEAFGDLGLTAINAWAVDLNVPSIRILERNGFRCIGRQRRCHLVDGRPADRLLFDLLKDEHALRSTHARESVRSHR
jgi:ribosomal-protein-alanine N-acetyltransferase